METSLTQKKKRVLFCFLLQPSFLLVWNEGAPETCRFQDLCGTSSICKSLNDCFVPYAPSMQWACEAEVLSNSLRIRLSWANLNSATFWLCGVKYNPQQVFLQPWFSYLSNKDSMAYLRGLLSGINMIMYAKSTALYNKYELSISVIKLFEISNSNLSFKRNIYSILNAFSCKYPENSMKDSLKLQRISWIV